MSSTLEIKQPSTFPTSATSEKLKATIGGVPPASAASGGEGPRFDTSGASLPVWVATAPLPQRYPPLEADTTAEVCIIGAGIAGLSVAYELSLAGKNVVVLEDGAICSGETGRTTAHLMGWFDDHYQETTKMLGLEKTKLIANAHYWAIDRIEEICREEQIDCEFERLDGYLINGLPEDDKHYSAKGLYQEHAAAKAVGIDVRLLDECPAVPGIRAGTTVVFPRQGQFQPLRYIEQLADRLVQRGVRIHCGTKVLKLRGGPNSYVETASGKQVKAPHIVEATNVPISNMISVIDKMIPQRSYAIAVAIPKSSAPRSLVWDMDQPYHYVRRTGLNETEDLLIIGGEDHETGTNESAEEMAYRFDRLETWGRARWPDMKDVRYRWSGQVIEPVDAAAFIGRNDHDYDNVYIVTADSGQGMTHSVIAGRLLKDLIIGHQNPWEAVFDPRRIPKNLTEVVTHNCAVGTRYIRWVQGSDLPDIEDIPSCQGAVISSRLPYPKHVAVYRDENGGVHKMSAVCPHAYGIVRWNPLEKTWDCPAHGSRFDRYGKCVNGPSSADLKKIQ